MVESQNRTFSNRGGTFSKRLHSALGIEGPRLTKKSLAALIPPETFNSLPMETMIQIADRVQASWQPEGQIIYEPDAKKMSDGLINFAVRTTRMLRNMYPNVPPDEISGWVVTTAQRIRGSLVARDGENSRPRNTRADRAQFEDEFYQKLRQQGKNVKRI